MASIDLGGQPYQLAATFQAARKIEQASELTLSELITAHIASRITLEEGAAIVHAGMEAAGEKVNFGAVAERLFELRLTDPEVRRSIGEYLAELHYHPDDTEKRAAVLHLLEHGGHENAPAI